MAQLVERLLPIPEFRGLNPVIGKNLLNIYLLLTVLKRRKEKRPGMDHLKKIVLFKERRIRLLSSLVLLEVTNARRTNYSCLVANLINPLRF